MSGKWPVFKPRGGEPGPPPPPRRPGAAAEAAETELPVPREAGARDGVPEAAEDAPAKAAAPVPPRAPRAKSTPDAGEGTENT